jgi:salicylate hydroxylase
MEEALLKHATRPRQCNYLGWKGESLASMNFHEYEEELGTPFWDFHRANLHMELLGRAKALGAIVETNSRVVDIEYKHPDDHRTVAVAVLSNGTRKQADLIVGSDGINSRCREILLGHPDPPVLTGDLAYRLLLNTEDMMRDPDLRGFVEDPQVNYWMGPDAHAGEYSPCESLLRGNGMPANLGVVNYVLRGGKLFNMVLLVPDDMPAGASTLAGNVEEMRALYKDWDPRIPKLLALCESVYKWRLCIRPNLNPTWSHESSAFTMLGDAAHATLPYLASGAGMSLEDGHVLGLCLGKLSGKSDKEKRRVLEAYERCRRERTENVVARGNLQQHLYHIHNGPERDERDRLLRAFSQINGKGPVTEEALARKGLKEGSDPFPWRWHGVGRWLLTYDCERDVEKRWLELECETTKAVAEGQKLAGRRAVL